MYIFFCSAVKSEVASPLPASDANPPILSPHGKIPKGFSQELAERLTAHTPMLKSGFNSNRWDVVQRL